MSCNPRIRRSKCQPVKYHLCELPCLVTVLYQRSLSELHLVSVTKTNSLCVCFVIFCRIVRKLGTWLFNNLSASMDVFPFTEIMAKSTCCLKTVLQQFKISHVTSISGFPVTDYSTCLCLYAVFLEFGILFWNVLLFWQHFTQASSLGFVAKTEPHRSLE